MLLLNNLINQFFKRCFAFKLPRETPVGGLMKPRLAQTMNESTLQLFRSSRTVGKHLSYYFFEV
jgi:hypothetical protein